MFKRLKGNQDGKAIAEFLSRRKVINKTAMYGNLFNSEELEHSLKMRYSSRLDLEQIRAIKKNLEEIEGLLVLNRQPPMGFYCVASFNSLDFGYRCWVPYNEKIKIPE